MLVAVTSSEVWDEAAAEAYDADWANMFSPSVLAPTVDCLARLADGGPALEFGIGTGRVALPLLGRGVQVSGIELSVPMVDQLRRKIDASALPVTVGDMATTQVRVTIHSSTWCSTASRICAPRLSKSNAFATRPVT